MSRGQAMLLQRCPRCYEGRLFTGPIFSRHFNKMEEHCPVCGLKYEIEPGFFWGSMYISYAIGVAIFVAVVIGGYIFLDNPPPWVYLSLLLGILLLLSPVIFRVSRIIMLYAFGSIKYDPKMARKKYQE